MPVLKRSLECLRCIILYTFSANWSGEVMRADTRETRRQVVTGGAILATKIGTAGVWNNKFKGIGKAKMNFYRISD